MISQFIIALSMVLNLGVGGHKQRDKATHSLKMTPISFLHLKSVKRVVRDPEVLIRLKEVAWFKWCLETDEKYRQADYYGENATLNNELQLEHFNNEWYD